MQKGFSVILILIGILVLGLVSGGAYYYGKPQTPQITPVPSPTPDASPAPTGAGETANWKTYSNKEGKFSLEYPNNWNKIFLTDKNSDYLPGVLLTPQSQKSLDRKKVENVPGIYIYAIEIRGCTNSANYVQKEIDIYTNNNDLYPNLKIRKLNSDTINGYIIDEGAPGAIVQKGPEAFIYQCPTEIQLSFDPTGIENNQQLFDQILSTFKFTQ